jgi:hypothetical protein
MTSMGTREPQTKKVRSRSPKTTRAQGPVRLSATETVPGSTRINYSEVHLLPHYRRNSSMSAVKLLGRRRSAVISGV